LKVGFVVGPTGIGKTAMAIAIAQRLGAEIVNADSRQIF
jgi:tRNA dimethylallyltransferase